MPTLMNLDTRHLRRFGQNVALVWKPTALIKTSFCLPLAARIELGFKQHHAEIGWQFTLLKNLARFG